MGPQLWIKIVDFSIGDVDTNFVFFHQTHGDVSDVLPFTVSEGEVLESGILVSNGVPNCVEIVSSLNRWKWNGISTEVTSLVVFVDSGGGVKWLMDITGVVDQESHGGGHTVLLSMILVSAVHDLLVLISVLISVRFVEPQVEGGQDLGDIVGIECEVKVFDVATLVEVWLINEMPSPLVLSTMVLLDDISESCTLGEHVISFTDGPLGIDVSQRL